MSLDLLFPHFDELVRTPEDVQRLNEAILQLAVQGKLVAQDPNDEPVKDLLYGIGMWIDETGLSNRVPFSVPHTWQWLRLGELRPEFQNGCSRRTSASTGIESVVIRLADIVHGAIALNNTRSIGLLPDERRKYHLKSGDILITRVNGSVDLIGGFTLVQEEVDLCYCDHFIRMRIDNQILHPAYLALVGKSALIRGQIREKFITTAGQKTVNQTHISTLWLPLAPLAEQLRIVTKVDEIFAQTRALEANLRQAQEDVVTVNRAALHRLHTAQDDDQFQVSWHTIRDHFDVLYDDPRNVSELRQTILDLAVRGKLVAQDPKDEPAEELLKTIEAKKKSLVNEGRIKRSSALLRNGSNMSYDLPEGWTWALVDDLCYVGTGSTPRRDEPDNYEDGQIPWITSAVTGMPFITEASEYISERALAETNCQVYPKHTLIVGMYGQGKTRGQVSELLIEASTNQACAALVFDGFSDCVRPYVKLFFQKNYLELRKLAEGGAQPNLNVGKIRTTSLPVPPLAEQQRIVAKIDQLMRLCDELEAVLAQTETKRRNVTAAVLQAG